jgi:hypothetical protein
MLFCPVQVRGIAIILTGSPGAHLVWKYATPIRQLDDLFVRVYGGIVAFREIEVHGCNACAVLEVEVSIDRLGP